MNGKNYQKRSNNNTMINLILIGNDTKPKWKYIIN